MNSVQDIPLKYMELKQKVTYAESLRALLDTYHVSLM